MKFMLQKIVLVPFIGALCLSVWAVPPVLADELTNISDIQGCRAIEGEAERLLCYDTVSGGGIFNEQQLKQVQVEKFGSNTMPKTLEPESTSTTTSVLEKQSAKEITPSESTPAARAVQSAPSTGTAISVDEINVTVVRVQRNGMGIHYFKTSDDQVWKQQNAASWSLTVPFEAKIQAGMMGSFFLVQEGGKSTRVKRLK